MSPPRPLPLPSDDGCLRMTARRVHGGAVAPSGHPEATAAAMHKLKHGGNAVDAVLAAALCQRAVSAQNCGPAPDAALA